MNDNIKIEIQFGKSSSINYEKALSIARKFKCFHPAIKDNPTNCILLDSKNDHKYIEPLYQTIRNWRTAKLIIDGEIKSIYELNHLRNCLRCYTDYKRAIIPEIHCQINKYQKGWGCKLLNRIRRHADTESYEQIVYPGYDPIYWYQFGHFVTDNIWRIDKKELLKKLLREVELKFLNMCPLFDIYKIRKSVNILPNEINLDETELWEKDYICEPGFEPVEFGVKPKEL